jgi:hypothetical protein
MATKQGGFLINLGKRMLGFSTSSSACCGAPGSTQQEPKATATPVADTASACCTPTAEAQAAGACCEESVAAAPSACCGSEPALVTILAAPASKTRAESADVVRARKPLA